MLQLFSNLKVCLIGEWSIHGSFVLFQFVFEGVVGSGYEGDIAIDDIQIVDQACSVFPSAADPSPSTPTGPIRKSCLYYTRKN